MIWWVARIVAVVALLGVASVISTPKGRLPLALRGLARLMHSDRGEPAAPMPAAAVPAWRRLLAFVLVLLAVVVAVI